MRSAGPPEHHIGAQGGHEVARPDTTRMRGQFRPESTIGVVDGERPDGGSDVVVHRTTLPFPADHEDRGGEHCLDPLPQFLTTHAEHLQLPIT